MDVEVLRCLLEGSWVVSKVGHRFSESGQEPAIPYLPYGKHFLLKILCWAPRSGTEPNLLAVHREQRKGSL